MERVLNVMRGGGGGPSFAPPPPQNLPGDAQALMEWIRGRPTDRASGKRPRYFLGSKAAAGNMRSGREPSEVEGLLDLFRRAPRTTGPVVLYRGMPKMHADGEDRAFITCTNAPEVAWRYAQMPDYVYVKGVVAVLVPPGTPMVSRTQLSTDSEYLLLPGRLAVAGPALDVQLPRSGTREVRDLFRPEWAERAAALRRLRPRWPDHIEVTPVYYTPDSTYLARVT